MSRRWGVLVLLALLLASVLLVPLTGAALGADGGTSGVADGAPHVLMGRDLGALTAANSSTNPNAIPAPTCPTPPVNTSFGSVNCFTVLDLTEVFVILIGLTITLYVYMGSARAELPGEASEVPVTADEEMEARLRKDEEDAREIMQEQEAAARGPGSHP